MADLTCGRRTSLRDVRAPNNVHPGLWLDRYLERQTWKKTAGDPPDKHDEKTALEAKGQLIKHITEQSVGRGYVTAYRRWRKGFQTSERRLGALAAEVDSIGRVLIGSGAKGAGEFGITLHHTWGVPVLPGSSLKGIAALGADRYLADDSWRRPDPAHPRDTPSAFDVLFGTVEERAAVTFHDAWLVPSSVRGRPAKNGLYQDVLTVHHREYYQNDGKLSDAEDPVPVSFVSASGTFLIVLELAPDLDPALHHGWLEAAWEALRHGLGEHGIGAKTNAAYGRFSLPRFKSLDAVQKFAEEKATVERNSAREQARAEMSPEERCSHIFDDEGIEAVKTWLLSDDAELIGMERDEAHVTAAIQVLIEKTGAAPDDVSPSLQRWAADAQSAHEASQLDSDGYRNLADAEIDNLIQEYTKKGRVDGRKLARELLKMKLNKDSLSRSMKRLQRKGIPGGHLGPLQMELMRR